MRRFLIDEDMPRSTAIILREAGFEADDVRDVGLRGYSDVDVFAYAQRSGATLITADVGFSNVLTFRLGDHHGIIVLRVPNELSIHQGNEELLRALAEIEDEALDGLLLIVEVGRTRIRRPRPIE